MMNEIKAAEKVAQMFNHGELLEVYTNDGWLDLKFEDDFGYTINLWVSFLTGEIYLFEEGTNLASDDALFKHVPERENDR
jgi:hypothetical protein